MLIKYISFYVSEYQMFAYHVDEAVEQFYLMTNK